MEVALVTVGDELLAGDTANTNGTWLAERLTERGVTVTRILAIPDERDLIARTVADYSDQFDAVVVTGGLGGTPDDRTMEAVADAFERDLVVNDRALAHVRERVQDLPESVPDLDLEPAAEARLPAGSRPLFNSTGLAPGCVLENVYVFPGIPRELKAMFDDVAEEFVGDAVSTFLYTEEPEANIVPTLETVAAEFDVTVGCYPDSSARHNRLKITATDDASLTEAADRLRDQIDVSETPIERDWSHSDAAGADE